MNKVIFALERHSQKPTLKFLTAIGADDETFGSTVPLYSKEF